MESKSVIFFLFLCLFNLISSQIFLESNNKTDFSGREYKNYTISLKQDIKFYSDYINIIFFNEGTSNPIILIANKENCNNDRLFMSAQASDIIYAFLKKGQIGQNFYICITRRESSTPLNYKITIKNEKEANIPYDAQASYYVSNLNVEMNFLFLPQKNYLNSKVTFWVKGGGITDIDINNKNLEKQNYENLIIYYGNFPDTGVTLLVKSKIRDYVNIGSTIVLNDGNTIKMRDNSIEKVIASKTKFCLPFEFREEVSFISGNLYKKNDRISFVDLINNPLTKNGIKCENNINNGIINDLNNVYNFFANGNQGLYCFDNKEQQLMVLDIQIINKRKILTPLIPGEIRRNILEKGEIAIFYAIKPNIYANKVNLISKAIKGFPEMYFVNCGTFPNCFYKKEDLGELINPYPVNMMNEYSFNKTGYQEFFDFPNSIPLFQPLMIIYCREGVKIDSSNKNQFCEFDTSYFTNLDTINLYKESTFSQYLVHGDESKFSINLKSENVPFLYLDLIVFSGDANLNIISFTGEINKYYLANKIFFTFKLGYCDNLRFNVVALTNCLYTLQYQYIQNLNDYYLTTIESGFNYISFIAMDEKPLIVKQIDLMNFNYDYNMPYLATFYSPNCKFDLYWLNDSGEEANIIKDNYIAQKIIENNDINYKKQKYQFNLKITKDEIDSLIDNKYCLIYSAGLELFDSISNIKRSIILSEGVPHRYIFTPNHAFIFYSYYVSDINKTLVLNFNLIDINIFLISIQINNDYLERRIIYKNSQLYIKKQNFDSKCKGNKVCAVLIKVEMTNFRQILEGRFEFSIYQIDSSPIYLERNIIKQYILHGNKTKHYYLEINKGEYGDITLDFKKRNGNIYASIQSRDSGSVMDQPNWRDSYHFPKDVNESLEFNYYNKKINISKKDTESCNKGCYILISIIRDNKYYELNEDETISLRFSINPRIINAEFTKIESPKVRIDVNEFVIGNILYDPLEIKYDYYTVILPFDSEYLFIDWQAYNPCLIMNIGTEKPVKENANFTFSELKHDTVLKIGREEIINKTNIANKNSLKGITLTLGIYTENNDYTGSTPYAFKLFFPQMIKESPNTVIEIIPIRSDQKVQCLPFNYHDKNICLFSFTADDIDYKKNVIIYFRNKDDTIINIYSPEETPTSIAMINLDIFIIKMMNEFMGNPKNKINEKYVYLQNIDRFHSYFFVTFSEDNSDSIIEVYSSSQVFGDDITIYPNPSTPQIFATLGEKVNFNFFPLNIFLLI